MAGRRIVVVNASGEVSGAELVVLRLIARALERGETVLVASPGGPLVERLPAGVTHLELPPAGRGGATGLIGRAVATVRWLTSWPGAARRLAREVRRPGTHTVVNSLLALPVVRLARPVRPPVWLVHDVVVTARQRAFVRFGAAGRTRIVAVSEAAAAPLRRLGRHGRTVAVRPNGVAWPVDPAPVEAHDPPRVGSLGLLTSWKGQHVLLEAVARLPEVHVELAGSAFAYDAGYVAELHDRTAAADLAGRARLIGPTDDALETMRGWDVFVSASTSPEAGPMTVVEAMSVGVPVVATAHGGPLEYLADGRGELVPPGDPEAMAAAIRRLLADPARRRRLAERGRRLVADRFDRAATTPAQYEAVMMP